MNFNIRDVGLEEIFSTKERKEIIERIIYSEKEIKVSIISKELGLSKGLLSKYLKILAEENILQRNGNSFLVNNNHIVKSIKIMLCIQKIPQIFEKYKFVRAAGLYGSCAKGTNTESSDMDLWIKVDNLTEKRLAELSNKIREKVQNVSILLIDEHKLNEIKKDNVFYHSLVFGSIILYGGENEIHE